MVFGGNFHLIKLNMFTFSYLRLSLVFDCIGTGEALHKEPSFPESDTFSLGVQRFNLCIIIL